MHTEQVSKELRIWLKALRGGKRKISWRTPAYYASCLSRPFWLILSKQKVVLPYSNFGRLSLGCSAIAIVSLEFAYT